MERVNRDVINRKSKESRNRADAAAKDTDGKFTFKPQINPKSEDLRPRSAYELSRGDSLRRDSNQKLTKLRSEQEMLAKATFQPVISAYAERNNIHSKLALSRKPGAFLEDYKKECDRKQIAKETAIREQVEAEKEVCTFAPQTTTCPAYIRRIAKSMQIVKASRKLSATNTGGHTGSGSLANRPPSTWR